MIAARLLPVGHSETMWRVALVGIAAAGLSMISPEAARAGLYSLNTGISTTPTGGPDLAVDNLWKVSYSLGSPVIDTTKVVGQNQGAFPFGYWMDNTAESKWLTPSSFDRNNAPPPSGQPLTFAYYTTFNLSRDAAAVATLSGRWSSDNDTVLVKLNNTTIYSGDTGYEPFRYWTSLGTVGAGSFQAGLNTLVFDVLNQPQGSGNPTGFRFEGAVSDLLLNGGVIVPEPSTLLAGLVGAALFGIHALRTRRQTLAP